MCDTTSMFYSKDYETVRVPIRHEILTVEVDKITNLIVKDGQVVVDEPGYRPVRITRGMIDGHIRVGCHKFSKEAWELIKKKIDRPGEKD